MPKYDPLAGDRPEGERIAKLLARAGVASRREVERMIAEGRVALDGKVLETPATILPTLRGVTVDGKPVGKTDQTRLFAFHKPSGLITAENDPKGRPTIYTALRNALPKDAGRVMPIGRLDFNTEGLLLLTNDGEMAHRLMHPSFEVPKTYLATVNGEVNYRLVGKRLREGVELEDGPAKVDKFMLLEAHEGRSLVKLVLHEGRKHIVRRLLDEVGHPVIRLVRTHLGPVALGDQRPGTLRVLGRDEIGKLYEAVQL